MAPARGFPDWQAGVQYRPASSVDDGTTLAPGGSTSYPLGQLGSWPSLWVDFGVSSGGCTIDLENDYSPGVRVPDLPQSVTVVAGQGLRALFPILGQSATLRVFADPVKGCSYLLSAAPSGVTVANPATPLGLAASLATGTIPASGNVILTPTLIAAGRATISVVPGAGSATVFCYMHLLNTDGSLGGLIAGLNDNVSGERTMAVTLPFQGVAIQALNSSGTATANATVGILV